MSSEDLKSSVCTHTCRMAHANTNECTMIHRDVSELRVSFAEVKEKIAGLDKKITVNGIVITTCSTLLTSALVGIIIKVVIPS